MAKRAVKTEREITVLARWTVKKDHTMKDGRVFKAGWIVLLTVNDKGDRHFVILRPNGNSCDCKAAQHGMPCYHIKQSVEAHTKLSAEATERKASKISKALKIASQRDYKSSDELIKKTSLSSNRGFSLLAS